MAGVPPLWGPLAALGQMAMPYGPMAYNLYKKIRSRQKSSVTKAVGGSIGKGVSSRYAHRNAGEPRTFDTHIADNMFSTSTNAMTNNIAVIPHNATVHGRSGRRCLITGFLIRGTIIAGTTQTIPQNVGFTVVVDKKPRGDAGGPAASAVFETDNAPLRLTNALQGGVRFKHLMRRMYSIIGDGDTTANAYNAIVHVNEYRKCHFEMTWDDSDTSGSSATLDENGLFLMIHGEGADATTSPRCDFNVRVYYKDLD